MVRRARAAICNTLLHAKSDMLDCLQFLKSLGNGNDEMKQLNISGIWYQSSDNKGHSPSGAYLFRPVATHGQPGPIKTEIVKGPVVSEFRQVYPSQQAPELRRLPCQA